MNAAADRHSATRLAGWLTGCLMTLAGCASINPYASAPMAEKLARDDLVGYCARLFADIDRRVDMLAVRDAETHRIDGFPHLRVDRFTAALADRATDPARRQAWYARLQQLDETARSTELTNAELSVDDIQPCRRVLAEADADAFVKLRSAARVPDDYSFALRAVGLYPVTRVAFAAGVANWHADTLAVFATPLDALPVQGQLQRYSPAKSVPLPVPAVPVDALGVPVLSPEQQAALLLRHAPVLEIDVAGAFDRPGALVLDGSDRAVVDTDTPVVYTRLTYTIIGGVIHPQLVYTFWFSERPAAEWPDLLAGRLDGLVWRVTVDRTGEALVYDSMHACGCYHMFFTTERVAARGLPRTLDEGLFVPQAVQAPQRDDRVVLRVQSGTHYLQRVRITAAAEPTFAYALRHERELTSLQRRSGGTRSAYDETGMIVGSERAERWFFWPMGIESAGQMRQWGRHATAFIGRRHFDDTPFDAYFELRQ